MPKGAELEPKVSPGPGFLLKNRKMVAEYAAFLGCFLRRRDADERNRPSRLSDQLQPLAARSDLMSKVTHIPHLPAEGVDFQALMRSFWKQRKMVGVCTLVGGVVFAAYAFLATPEYVSSTVLRPVALNELDALNRSKLYELPPKEALQRVRDALDSYDVRLGYFRENKKLFETFDDPAHTLEQNFEEFDREALWVVTPDLKQINQGRSYAKLQMTYPAGLPGPQIINGFVEYAINQERKQIEADMDVIIRNRLNELDSQIAAAKAVYEGQKETEIASLLEGDRIRRGQLQDELKALRQQLKTIRGDRISQLDEAITIADSLGIKRPSTPSSLGDAERGAGNNVVRTEVNNQSIPLYFMGTEALKAERKVLMSRKADDFTEARIAQIQKELQMLSTNRRVEALNARQNEAVFLQGLEGLRKERVRLKNLDFDLARLKLVTIDQKALQPARPAKPKRLLLCLGGLIAGLLVGLILTVFRHLLAVDAPVAARIEYPEGR